MADGEGATGLVRYEAMCRAIAECVRVDEAQDIRNKSMALEAYYRQARNLGAEREAANVRLRAERRVGELLKELARADAPNPSGRNQHEVTSVRETQPTQSPYAAALEEHGMSRQTASRFQALADIPAETFENALRAPEKPTTAGVLKHREAREQVRDPMQERKPGISDASLMLWGHLRDFETEGFFHADGCELFITMTDAMRADVRRLAPLVASFLTALEGVHEPA